MVLHHVTDIENIIRKFHNLLNPDGHLAIADLYTEDGSFHGKEFTGHKGFDTGFVKKLPKTRLQKYKSPKMLCYKQKDFRYRNKTA